MLLAPAVHMVFKVEAINDHFHFGLFLRGSCDVLRTLFWACFFKWHASSKNMNSVIKTKSASNIFTLLRNVYIDHCSGLVDDVNEPLRFSNSSHWEPFFVRGIQLVTNSVNCACKFTIEHISQLQIDCQWRLLLRSITCELVQYYHMFSYKNTISPYLWVTSLSSRAIHASGHTLGFCFAPQTILWDPLQQHRVWQ